MPITTRKKGDVTILDVAGKVTIGAGDVELRNKVQDALNGGATKLLLNLKDTTTIDSSGIGEFVSTHVQTTNRGGKLKLHSLPPRITDLLFITKLITVFDIYDTEDEAIAAFA
ncbi:STAS domain-containing protein [Inquilinus sp.]|jgi:anti-sigma B factor antagonist|uniref:STAS domain-containing protein n=1 Tax=Inquilinus sp. TaxID=1932117 RepID=UPI0037839B96